MKRSLPLFALLALTAALVPVLTVFGEGPKEKQNTAADPLLSKFCKSCCQGCCAKCCPTKAVSVNDQLLQELTTILKETRSRETFVVTVMALSRMGADAKRTVPDIIRNAERLELLKDLATSGTSSEKPQLTQEIVVDIQAILDGTPNPRTPNAYGYAATYGYPSYPAYPTGPVYEPTPTGVYAPTCPPSCGTTPQPTTSLPAPAPSSPVATPTTPKDKPRNSRSYNYNTGVDR